MASSKSKKENVSFGDLQQDIVQAVIVADSFNVRFAPLSIPKPRVLLPLVNRPLLDYSLEYLRISGVQEVFVLGCSHAAQIKEYLKNSPWCNDNSTMVVYPITSEGYLSLGDALRELDAKGLIRSDFILLGGDIISNLPLLDILQEHRKQVQKDKGCIMTMVFRKAAPKHRTRTLEDEAVICVESSTNRILHYQKVANQSKIDFPMTLIQEHKEMSLRYDLLDTHISICSKHVPTLFVDNFDFQTRDNFVKGILINEEILGNSIYLSVAETGYAARVSNFHMYDSISQDIIQRWSYPVVPDTSVKYNYLRHNVYRHKDVDLARECTLEKNVVIGSGTKIGNKTFISNSTLGQNCVIGDNVTIKGSYLWDNVIVEDNCVLTCCLLANGVQIKKDCTIGRGCVLSYNVIIGPNIKLAEGTLWQAEPQKLEDDFDDEKVPDSPTVKQICDTKVVGSLGLAYPFEYHALDDSSEDEENIEISYRWGFDASDKLLDEASASESEPSDSENSSEEGGSPPPDDTKLFYNEVLDSLLRGVEENVKSDNLILEVNSSKYAYNITMKEVNMLVIKAVLEIPIQQSNTISSASYGKAIEPLLKKMLPLLKNYIRSVESQNDCLVALEEYSLGNDVFAPVLIKVLKFLYDRDVFDEEVILKWHSKPPTLNDIAVSQQKLLRNRVQKFIDWLQEAEEESD